MKTYFKPSIDIVKTSLPHLLTNSTPSRCYCDSHCRWWHRCLDRKFGMYCEDYLPKP